MISCQSLDMFGTMPCRCCWSGIIDRVWSNSSSVVFHCRRLAALTQVASPRLMADFEGVNCSNQQNIPEQSGKAKWSPFVSAKVNAFWRKRALAADDDERRVLEVAKTAPKRRCKIRLQAA
jgi:hypothetical protein